MQITNYLPSGQLNRDQLNNIIGIPKKCGSWFGSNLMSARVRASPSSRACKKLLRPSPLWLGFIVVWTNCGFDCFKCLVILPLFNWYLFN